MTVIRIMRGLPGSGKSTHAKMVIGEAGNAGISGKICSADNYFVGPDGVYRFNPKQLSEAHKQCFETFINALYDRVGMVIIDNTNIKLSEFEMYVKIGAIANIEVQVHEIRPKSSDEIEAWHKRCVHNVPLENIMSRSAAWQEIPESWRVKRV